MPLRLSVSLVWIASCLAFGVACGSSGGSDEALDSAGTGQSPSERGDAGNDPDDDGRPRRENVGAPIKIPNFGGDYTRTASHPTLGAFRNDVARQCGGGSCVRLAPYLIEGDPPITDDCYVTWAEPYGEVNREKRVNVGVRCYRGDGTKDGDGGDRDGDGGPTDTPAEPSPTAGDG